jgi:hypothetical protein
MRTSRLLVALLISGCGTTLSSDGPVEIELRIGELVQRPDFGESIEFLSVPADSRCPSDVTCVWAGDAAIRLRIGHPSFSGDTTLHTTTTPRATTIGGVRIEVVGLRPTPVSNLPIDPKAYRVTLRLTADSGTP